MNDTPQNSKNYSNIQIKKLDNAEVEIEGEISAQKLGDSREKAVKKLSQTLTIPGFRPGKAPENVLIKHIGEYPILEDAAEIALTEEYPLILQEHAIDAIGRPAITITKLAADNPLGFKIKTAVMPKFDLPDYKKIAGEKNSQEFKFEVNDKEVDEAIQRIRENKAHHDLHAKLGKDTHDHAPIKPEDLPTLDDNFAKSVGDYKDVGEFRLKVKESLIKEKEYQEREKIRIEIVESILSQTKIAIPAILVEAELAKMIAQLKEDVTRAGIQYEDYLKETKKTEEGIKKEWNESAEKKAKFQLILNKIAALEQIEPDKTMLEHEAKQLMEMYKDADPERIRIYVETILVNEQVLKFLENQK